MVSCSTPQSNSKEDSLGSAADLAAGFQLLEANCFSCHSPKGNHDNRIAPPMIAIKQQYVLQNTTKNEFTADLIAYVTDPSEENTKMPEAVEQFGVMPKMNFSAEQLTQIAGYIYDVELESPGWFEKHYQEEQQKYKAQEVELSTEEQGLKFAMSTKSILGKNLLGAINANGSADAVEFCNTRAIHLTDSMSGVLNAQIKRVSDLPRNPSNLANDEELEYILKLKANIENGDKLLPHVVENGANAVGYYPITTNAMCMQCHGTPGEQIKDQTMAKIDSLYPHDQAKGYGEDELRGIWVVNMTMDK